MGSKNLKTLSKSKTTCRTFFSFCDDNTFTKATSERKALLFSKLKVQPLMGEESRQQGTEATSSIVSRAESNECISTACFLHLYSPWSTLHRIVLFTILFSGQYPWREFLTGMPRDDSISIKLTITSNYQTIMMPKQWMVSWCLLYFVSFLNSCVYSQVVHSKPTHATHTEILIRLGRDFRDRDQRFTVPFNYDIWKVHNLF